MPSALDGLRVFVVEDRAHTALMLCDLLEDHGCHVVGPAPRIEQAMKLARTEQIDVALLDIDLDGVLSYPVAELLRQRNVPAAFLTGFDASSIPPEYADLPMLEKPVSSNMVLRLIRKLADR